MPKPKGSVNAATLRRLRDQYCQRWSRPWPFGDDYLRELWGEVRDENAKGRYDDCLTLMRESHDFTPGDRQGCAGPTTSTLATGPMATRVIRVSEESWERPQALFGAPPDRHVPADALVAHALTLAEATTSDRCASER